MFGNRERRGKEKRRMYFFLVGLLYRRKWKENICTRCIKVMGKYVVSCHTILFMWASFKKKIKNKNPFLPSNLPNLGGLQICGPRGNGFFYFISSIVNKQRKGLHFFSFLFFSSLLKHFQTHCKSLGFQSPYPWVKLSYIKERKNKEVLKVLIRLG